MLESFVSKVECVTKDSNPQGHRLLAQYAIECLPFLLCAFIKFAAKNLAEGANFCSNRK